MKVWLETQGIVFSEGGKYRPLILKCIAEAGAIFPDLIDTVSDCFIYNQREQKYEDGLVSDAIFWYHTAEDGIVLFAIGVSTAAAAMGEEYLLMCILHELAHLEMVLEEKWEIGNIHSATFHYILDGLIEKFNRETGRAIENDYYGLNDRADSKGFTLNQSKTRNRKK